MREEIQCIQKRINVDKKIFQEEQMKRLVLVKYLKDLQNIPQSPSAPLLPA